MDEIRVGIIGVGNCASSLVQGVNFYRDAKSSEDVPGLMHVDLGGYHISDIKFTAAVDIDRQKVGRDLSEATLCRIAYAYEQATDWHTRHPDV